MGLSFDEKVIFPLILGTLPSFRKIFCGSVVYEPQASTARLWRVKGKAEAKCIYHLRA